MKEQIAKIMEDELFSENPTAETSEEFVRRVCLLYLTEIEKNNGYALQQFAEDVVEEVHAEVLEVFRTKTYGYYNISQFRMMLLSRRPN